MFAQKSIVAPKATSAKRAVAAQAGAPAMVPDMAKRNTMNAILLAGTGLPVAALGIPYALFFAPPSAGGAGGGQVAKDALGNDIKESAWLKTHAAGDRQLAQGLKGDPTYLIVKEDNTIEKYGLNAVCTHLGCVVPWVPAENKFKCPCHGSQYAPDGHVIRGPAPRPLALAHVSDDSGKILLSSWTETDFRTGEKPWWS